MEIPEPYAHCSTAEVVAYTIKKPEIVGGLLRFGSPEKPVIYLLPSARVRLINQEQLGNAEIKMRRLANNPPRKRSQRLTIIRPDIMPYNTHCMLFYGKTLVESFASVNAPIILISGQDRKAVDTSVKKLRLPLEAEVRFG